MIKQSRKLSVQKSKTQRKHNGYNNVLHAFTTKVPSKHKTATKHGFLSLSLSLSRKIASVVSALALSTLTFLLPQTLQAQTPQNSQNPQSTDEKIKQLEKELRLLELQKQIDQAKKEQSSNKPADKATDDSSATSPVQTTQNTPQKPTKHYDYGYDRSGSFVGVELGYGELLNTANTNYGELREKDGGFKYGLLLGYNKFFIKYFGIRFYGNANVTQVKDKANGDWVYRLNYGANLDALANFLATDYADFGAFVGLGVGGQTYFFTGQNKEVLDAFESMGVNVSYTSVDVGLNVGLRTNIAKHLGIEVAARVPFIKHNMFEVKGAYVLQETYSISARLLWNF